MSSMAVKPREGGRAPAGGRAWHTQTQKGGFRPLPRGAAGAEGLGASPAQRQRGQSSSSAGWPVTCPHRSPAPGMGVLQGCGPACKIRACVFRAAFRVPASMWPPTRRPSFWRLHTVPRMTPFLPEVSLVFSQGITQAQSRGGAPAAGAYAGQAQPRVWEGPVAPAHGCQCPLLTTGGTPATAHEASVQTLARASCGALCLLSLPVLSSELSGAAVLRPAQGHPTKCLLWFAEAASEKEITGSASALRGSCSPRPAAAALPRPCKEAATLAPWGSARTCPSLPSAPSCAHR